jgi:hypothetical protein
MNKVKAPFLRSQVGPFFNLKLKGGYRARRETFNVRFSKNFCKRADGWVVTD